MRLAQLFTGRIQPLPDRYVVFELELEALGG
ncbi:hypothetical protein OKW28_007599 [Paraburkholderia sp. 40]